MFIGHFAPAFIAATQPAAPRLGLGLLFVAAQLVDIGFFTLLILGVEHARLVPFIMQMNPMDLYDMPWTHSLAGALGWAAGFALVLRVLRLSWAGALIGAAVVVSHWFIDLLVHRPDLTLWGGPPKLGLGLWNLPAIEVPLELFFAFGGLAWYVRCTEPTGAAGRWSALVLGMAMAVLQGYNWLSPQPHEIIDPAPVSLGYLGLFAYALLAAAAWWAALTRSVKA